MAAAIGLITIGGILVVSALKGVGVVELASGAVLGTLNPKGGRKEYASAPVAVNAAAGGATGAVGAVDTSGGAKGIVEELAAIAIRGSGGKMRITSSIRPGASTSSGNTSDHSRNDETMAARDVGGFGAAPTPDADRGVAAVMHALGARGYKAGQPVHGQNFTVGEYRVQIIWRSQVGGNHNDHMHAGARRR